MMKCGIIDDIAVSIVTDFIFRSLHHCDKSHYILINYTAKSRSKLTLEQKKYLNQYYCRSWKAWVGRHTYSAISEDRSKGRLHDIDIDYITELLNRSSKCCISGLELTHDKSLYSLSIDRIDNRCGHLKNNVQLVCMGVNLAKNRHTDGDVKFLLECINGREFIPDRISRDYISVCVRNSKNRDRIKQAANDITTDEILKILEDQHGKCCFSGINLACYKHPCLSISIDRIDNNLGHVIGNVRLVAKSINLVKGRRLDGQLLDWLKAIRNYENNRTITT